MKMWHHRGQRVEAAPRADIPIQYRPEGLYAGLVQTAINAVPFVKVRGESIATIKCGQTFCAIVATADDRPCIWGIYAGHRASRPELSPFVEIDPVTTSYLTVD